MSVCSLEEFHKKIDAYIETQRFLNKILDIFPECCFDEIQCWKSFVKVKFYPNKGNKKIFYRINTSNNKNVERKMYSFRLIYGSTSVLCKEDISEEKVFKLLQKKEQLVIEEIKKGYK